MSENLPPNFVWVAQAKCAGYGKIAEKFAVETPENTIATASSILVHNLFKSAGLDSAHYGTAEWNPMGDLISQGDNVLLKPNWVLDENKLRGGGMDCLVTHTSVIEAVLNYVVKTQPDQIIVGDAPLQSCDFDNLRLMCSLDEMVARFKCLGHEIQIRDFRLTKMKGHFSDKIKAEHDPENYCLFDLGQHSWLTPVTTADTEFRVANYNPCILKQHHDQKTHQYLIAREVLDADVVINLPKLKTHQKTGVTGALKNMVGINGFKEYLPHYRKGGTNSGGDCYEGGGWLKSVAEDALDRANRSKNSLGRFCNIHLAGLAMRLGSMMLRQNQNLGGSWHGNDTVWRMCLDLQRILHYGTSDGKLASSPQRKVITITDAIIAGEGDGPLSPNPVPLGVMTLGTNVSALEWVHCLLMRLNPERIPLVAHAFTQSDWPLVRFPPNTIKVFVNGEILLDLAKIAEFSQHFTLSPGWKGHCEKKDLQK